MKRNAIGLALIGAFIFTIALSASPQLHERLHPGATQAQHECAATLIASGNCEHSAPPSLFVMPVAFAQSDLTIAADSFVSSLFLNACILEHAPPQNS